MNCQHIRRYLALYVSGDLSSPKVKSVESHLAHCPTCRAFLDDLRSDREALRALKTLPLDEIRPDNSRVRIDRVLNERRREHSPRTIRHFVSPRLVGALAATLLLTLLILAQPLYRQWLEQPNQPSTPGMSAPAPPSPPSEPRKARPPHLQEQKSAVVLRAKEDIPHLIRGRVTGPNDEPLKDVTVIIRDRTDHVLHRLTTNADGRFQWQYPPDVVPFSITAVHPTFGTLVHYFIDVNPPRSEIHLAMAGTGSASKPTPGASEWASLPDMSKISPGQSASPSSVMLRSVFKTEVAPETLKTADEIVLISPDVAGFEYLKQPRIFNMTELERASEEELPEHPGLMAKTPDGTVVGFFPLKRTRVTADISGYIAETRVEQFYKNTFKEPVEAVYVFPLPHHAAVHDFVMKAGGRTIVGLVRPREEAERMYAQARARGYTVSLLTQERPNIFTQQVANIEPGGTVRIQITYFERLPYINGWYEYVFPMVVGPRYIPGEPITPAPGAVPSEPAVQTFEEGPVTSPTDRVPDADRINPPVLTPGTDTGHRVELTINLDAGFPIRALQIPTHPAKITYTGSGRRRIELDPSKTRADRDFILRWRIDPDSLTFSVLTHREDENGYFTLMAIPPIAPDNTAVSPRELTFILDVSGSMSGIPLETSKNLMLKTLDHLRPFDRFNIITFASESDALWDHPRPATPANIAQGRQFVRSLLGAGGTEMLAGFQRAIAMPHDPAYLQMFVFLTDGYIGNDHEILAMVHKYRHKARFFAFGIGSSVNRYLINGIGEEGGGTSMVVIPRHPNEAARAMQQFFQAIDSPVLVDVHVDWGGLPVTDIFPPRVPDLYAGKPLALIGRYTRPARGTITVTGRVGTRTLRFKIPVRLPAHPSPHPALVPLWARAKIKSLMKNYTTAPDPETKRAIKQKITDMGVRYRLATAFTAFVAVDQSHVVGTGRPIRLFQPVELPQYTNDQGTVGQPPEQNPVKFDAWGVQLTETSKGFVYISRVVPSGPAAHAGILPGARIVAVEGIPIKGLIQLENLLLQIGKAHVRVAFEPGGTVSLPLQVQVQPAHD